MKAEETTSRVECSGGDRLGIPRLDETKLEVHDNDVSR